MTTFHRKCAGAVFLASLAFSGCAHAASDWSHPGDNPLIVGGTFGLLFAAAVWGTAEHFSTNPVSTYTKVKWLSGLVLGGILALCLMALLSGKTDSGLKTFVAIAYLVFALPHAGLIYVHRNSARQYVEEQARKKREAEEQREAQKVALEKAKKAAAAAELERSEKRKKAMEKKKAHEAVKETEALWRAIVLAIGKRDTDELRKLANTKQFTALPADSRLLAACVLSDVALVKSMLKAGADPNKSFADVFGGLTPLVATVGVSRSVEVAKVLLEAGADVNKPWSDNSTAVFEATSDEFLDLARLLVENGADVNIQLPNGFTPVIYAARNGASGCVDLFLDAGADINAVEEEKGIGAFGWALNRLDIKLAEHLFNRGAEVNFGTIDTLPLALAEHAGLEFVKGVDERCGGLVRDDQRGRMAFVSARNPDPEVFDYLLNHGADPSEGNDFGYTRLILATFNNRATLIRRFLEQGDDASVRDVDGETALSLALEKQHHEAVAALREFHVEEKDYASLAPEAAMFRAVEDGALGSILNMRDAGIPINIQDAEGNSPLMRAVKAGHLGVVRSLYHLGADLNHRNHAGETALAIAKAQDATDIVNSLQEFGALDAVGGELANFSTMFGGIAVYNAADTMFGRMSHPYKQTPPYDNPDPDANAETDADSDHNDGDPEDSDAEVAADDAERAVESKLDLLSQVLEADEIKDQLPEALIDQLTGKISEWRSKNELSGLDAEELEELNKILGVFGVGEAKAEEVARTPLFEAVHARDLAAVKKAIKAGADVNEVDGEGNTALLLATLFSDEKLVDALLKLGADPSRTHSDGKGPLFAAARTGSAKIAKKLLDAGAVVDAPFAVEHNGTPVGGCTALYAAALLGELAACKTLLGGGAVIDAANDIGYTPLMAAIEGDHEDVVDFLLKSGANINPNVVARVDIKGLGGTSPLYIATRKENPSVIKKLLKRGVDVNRPTPNGWTPLKSAAQQGSLEIARVLLDAGADPNIADNTNYTPLMNAASRGHVDIVKLLLKCKADPNVQGGESPGTDDWEPGRTALMDAAFSGNVAIVRDLIKHGANINLSTPSGRTALHSAAISGNPEMVSLLLKAGADVNVYEMDGDRRLSPLDVALSAWAAKDDDEREGGFTDVLELMLKKGMPIDRRTLNNTALEIVTSGRTEVITFLKERGVTVDPDEPMANGFSQLFIAVGLGDDRIDSVRLLLEMGADPNFRSPTGFSLLSMAVRVGAEKIVPMLLEAGADPMYRNPVGVLAYDLAAIYDRRNLASMLIENMNRVVPDVDRQDSEGNTGLMRAVKASDTKAIVELLAAGADASRRDRLGNSPLSYAVSNDLDEVVAILRAAGAERLAADHVGDKSDIVYVASKGALGSVLDLLDSGTPVDTTDADGNTPLTKAEPHPNVIRALAHLGADLSHRNDEGKNAYMLAAASKRTLVMRVLEEVGSPVEEPEELDGLAQLRALLDSLRPGGSTGDADVDETPEIDSDSTDEVDDESDGAKLLMASVTGDALAVSRQIAAGVDINYQSEDGRTPLMLALAGLARGGMSRRRERDLEQIIDSLLAAGADPNRGAFPALIGATISGRLHLVNALIRAGADINASCDMPTDEDGGTMLVSALIVALSPDEHGSHLKERIALTLLGTEGAAVDLFFSTDDGRMAVHYAASAGMSTALRTILDRAPEVVDARDKEGLTPLMCAAGNNCIDSICVLLERRADRTLCNGESRTAADIAAAAGHQEAAAALA